MSLHPNPVLHLAVEKDNLEIVNLLVQNDNIDIRSKDEINSFFLYKIYFGFFWFFVLFMKTTC